MSVEKSYGSHFVYVHPFREGFLLSHGIEVDSIPPSVLAHLAREDRGPKTIGLVVTFTALAFIAVCLRFFARVRLAINIGWEDHVMVVSMVSISTIV
jgi:hypothetical protein